MAVDAGEQYCILDGRSEQVLCGWLVGATLERHLSAIERNIVAEALRQLLLPAPEVGMEELREVPDSAWISDAWCCEFNLSTDVACATVFLCAQPKAAPGAIASNRPNLAGVALRLRATIPGITCQLGEIAQWRRGALLSLRRSERELGIVVYAGRRQLAAAHLGLMQGRRAIKLVQVLDGGSLL